MFSREMRGNSIYSYIQFQRLFEYHHLYHSCFPESKGEFSVTTIDLHISLLLSFLVAFSALKLVHR